MVSVIGFIFTAALMIAQLIFTGIVMIKFNGSLEELMCLFLPQPFLLYAVNCFAEVSNNGFIIAQIGFLFIVVYCAFIKVFIKYANY